MESTLDLGRVYTKVLMQLDEAFFLVENATNGTNRLIDVNEKMCRILGYNKQDLLGIGLEKIICLEDRDILDKNGRHESKVGFRTKNGHMFEADVDSVVVQEEEIWFSYHTIKSVVEPFAQRQTKESSHTAQSLLKSENRFRTLVSSMNDLVVTLDEQGCISNILGKWFDDDHELEKKYVGKRIEECFSDEDGMVHRQAFEEALKGNKSIYEWSLTSEGRVTYFQGSMSSVIHDHTTEVVAVTRDITAMKLKTLALQELYAQNQAILTGTAEGMIVIDKEGIITYINENVMKLMKKEKPILGKTLLELVQMYQDDFQVLARYETKEKMILEVLYSKDECEYHLEIVKQSIAMAQESLGDVLSVRDITFKKKSKMREKNIYDAIASGITVQTREGQIRFANRTASEILGYEIEQLRLMNSYDEAWKTIDENGNPLSRDRHPSMVTLSTGKEVTGAVIGVFNQVMNQYRWLLVDTRIIYEEENNASEIESVITTFFDITEKKEWDKRMHQAEKLAVIGQLAAAMAHEIRNPLTSIDGFLKLMKPSLNQKEQMYLEILFDEVAKIDLVTSEFLSLSKPQDEKKRLLQYYQEIIEPVMKAMRPLATMNSIKLDFSSEMACDPLVLGHKNQMKQLVMNLLKNAIEAMPSGGNIKLDLSGDEQFVKLKIIDEGMGIPSERLKHIGEPFYSLKEKGTGLGMMICYKILRDHGGEMHIKSKMYVGTTVEVLLPKHS
ncbi:MULTISPECIES: PAS domain S-box protein [unclassified Bacillus (in: firmicutes)]|uniref:PAS domain-containing protein n=1 Tax=unclassified Bacillus (in: firmicutes) TaxID=185979 RepID=UPI0008EEF63A|nr:MULTISPECIES: PAS domain S-box protein [unclassified Bacillus (in: firmicutes)]SFB03449.1 PAS domain S-box-containing protein [Bacillus sp. UNCCL13]SFQ88812.1 PAS domain S-box-containing protein [Bacillus sp. cl95]